MDILFPFNENKLKPYLKMASQRIKISSNKKSSQSKHVKNEVLALLSEGKEEMARIKVESMISVDFLIEALSIIQLFCELIHERVKYISSQKDVPADLLEAIASLVYATDKVDIEELAEVKNQFSKKYGSDFIKNVCIDTDGKVNARLIAKLKVSPPSAVLVTRYLNEIAKEANLNWTPSNYGIESEHQQISSPTGYSVPMAPGTGLRSAYESGESETNYQLIPQAVPVNSMLPPPEANVTSFDDLQARFMALQNDADISKR